MIKDNDVLIVDLARTAIGSFMGTLSGISAIDLGATVIRSLIGRSGISPEHIDEVIIGQVLAAGCGQNPARQTTLKSGIPENVPAFTINKVCGSGLKSLHLAFLTIKAGDADIIIAGGQENMSMAPHVISLSRKGTKIGPILCEDTMIKDGLWDSFNDYHMGKTAENITEKYNVTRDEQDIFAENSQRKATNAKNSHGFRDEIIPINLTTKKNENINFSDDEFHRSETTCEKLALLKTAFSSTGSITAGNSSGINDGAAMVILISGKKAKALGIDPLAVLQNVSVVGVDPAYMGTGPIPASKKVLERTGWQISDLDLIESNEAFAAQAIVVNREMGWDTNKVNVNGGAIALGHPIGASGCRIFVSLVHEMKRRNLKKGLATLCIGGGMGIAATVEML